MKNIGITQKITKDKNGYCFQIDKDWFNYFSKFKANLIPLGFDKFDNKKIDSFKLKGLIVTGGGDIYKIKKRKVNFLRDNFEYKIISKFRGKRIPILLVCRGFQLFGVKNGNKILIIKNHINKNHKVVFESNFQLNKKLWINTNSFHKYGFKNLNKNFKVLGKCKDGSIEIAKVKNKNIFCTMFHPERYNKDQKIIDYFVKNIFSI